ncbi:sortase [Streptomyces sp. NPDC049967]|uniref:sortase domain-containing protein n=1 Tax=unclassified Streptomyces TaxID=2593676 RepID=UPI002E294BDB|nr:sortase [Streptomyces sp. NBC_00342]
MARSIPASVAVAGVSLRAAIQPVRTAEDGEIPLPDNPQQASWPDSSVTPGERGTAILAGHVDSTAGPAAFYNLSAVKPGMPVTVSRKDGSTAHFTIDAVAVYPKDDFPSSTVYGPTPGPSLRLITCTGWNADTREYHDNVVVYATPHTRPPSR